MAEIAALPVINLTISGAPGKRGPRGEASGPLGEGSVDAETISDDEVEQSGILDKLGGVPFRGSGAVFIDGGTTSGLGLARDDAAIAIRAPAAGSPGQRHALLLFEQQHTDDEWAITGFHTVDGAKVQTGTYFNALQAHDPDPATFRPYQAMHGVSWRGDYTPFIAYNDGAVEMGGVTTGSAAFDLGLTEPDWVRVFTNTILQGGLKVGNTTQSYTTGFLAEIVGGALFVGDQASGGGAARQGVTAGYNGGFGGALLQGYNFGTSSLIDMYYNAAKHVFAGGDIEFDNDNARSVGTASKRASTIYAGTGTINTSDASLKTLRGDGSLNEAERRWASAIQESIKAYRFNDALEAKGDAARIHFGVLAQEVEAAGRQVGIADPFAYAFLCRDQVLEETTEMVPVERPVMVEVSRIDRSVQYVDGKWRVVEVPVLDVVPKQITVELHDAQGNVLMRRVPDPHASLDEIGSAKRPLISVPVTAEVPVTEIVHEPQTVLVPKVDEGGAPVWRYGVRYDELMMFLSAAATSC